tara:strand:- start:5157 stop:5822 length:666 start_codon:yes stop_codon:yes gene_type:complete
MKIALLLRGLAYYKQYKHWKSHVIPDYEINYKNYIENHDDMFEKYQVDRYFHTYKTKNLDNEEMVKKMSPIKYKITDPLFNYDKSHCEKKKRMNSLKNSMIEALELVVENVNDYDFIILTRYDIKFHKKIDLSKLDKNTIYSTSYCTIHKKLIDDNFIIIPPNLVLKVLNILKNWETNTMHTLLGELKKNKLNFLPLVDEVLRYQDLWTIPSNPQINIRKK